MSLDSEDAYKRLEKDWRSMIFIAHDFFHRWHQVVEEKYGKEEAEGLTLRFWELVGQGTGESYLKRGRDTENLEQVVKAMMRASEVMGEQARMEADGDDYLLIHEACPWIDSFKNYGTPGECQAGCDHWFATAAMVVSPKLKVKTEGCLAAGDNACVRRYSKQD